MKEGGLQRHAAAAATATDNVSQQQYAAAAAAHVDVVLLDMGQSKFIKRWADIKYWIELRLPDKENPPLNLQGSC